MPDRLELIQDPSVIDTLRPIQNKTGGFGGGHGQLSHLATTYASVLSLVMVGGEEAFELIDQEAMCVNLLIIDIAKYSSTDTFQAALARQPQISRRRLRHVSRRRARCQVCNASSRAPATLAQPKQGSILCDGRPFTPEPPTRAPHRLTRPNQRYGNVYDRVSRVRVTL